MHRNENSEDEGTSHSENAKQGLVTSVTLGLSCAAPQLLLKDELCNSCGSKYEETRGVLQSERELAAMSVLSLLDSEMEMNTEMDTNR